MPEPITTTTKSSNLARLLDVALEDESRESGWGEFGTPLIPDHTLLRRIGRGGYGEVWLARNIMGEFRAVKIVHRGDFDADRPFERELEGIRKFEPVSRTHERHLDILHVGRSAEFFYYVMELADHRGVDGFTGDSYEPRTLKSDLKQRERLEVEEVVRIGAGVAEGLAELHEAGLVHRDIKLSNVVFVGGAPKLADIGLVTDRDATMSFVGTEGYVPPEGPGTPQADVYSLGKMLYECVTGLDRGSFPEWPAELESGVGAEIRTVLERACAANVANRHASARELLEELRLLERNESVRERRRLESRLSVLRRVGIGLAATLAIAAGVFFVQQRHAAEIEELVMDGLARLEETEIREAVDKLKERDTGAALVHAIEASRLARQRGSSTEANDLRVKMLLDDYPRVERICDWDEGTFAGPAVDAVGHAYGWYSFREGRLEIQRLETGETARTIDTGIDRGDRCVFLRKRRASRARQWFGSMGHGFGEKAVGCGGGANSYCCRKRRFDASGRADRGRAGSVRSGARCGSRAHSDA